MLRIGDLGFAYREPEERRVKHVDVVENGLGLHAVWLAQVIGAEARLHQLFIAKETNRFDAVAEIAPELTQIPCSRQTTSQADNCNVVVTNVEVF